MSDDVLLAPTAIAPSTRRERWGWHAVALAVYLAALGSYFHAFRGEDLGEVVPAKVPYYKEFPAGVYPTGPMTGTDHRFVVWLIARNAYTFLTRPGALFEAEPCYPAENALLFSEPGITLGLQAIPAWLLTADPVATYNLTLFGMTLLHALAMYLLVREWTGVPGAGVVAGLLFAFHVIRFTDTVHIYVWDASWTIFAFLFAQRLFAHRRWRDAVGLAVCCVLQIGGSFYPLVGAAILALPLTMWLVARYGVRDVRFSQWGFVMACIGLAAAFVLLPYLTLRAEGGMQSRSLQLFRPLVWLFDTGEHGYAGPVLLALAAFALVVRRDRVFAPGLGDPRLALVVGWLLSVALAFGAIEGETPIIVIDTDPSEGIKNFYMLLAAVIPGFDVVRSPASLYAGAHLVQCLLAGFGAAALIRWAPPRAAVPAALALIALAYVDTLRPASLGFQPRMTYEMFPLSPRPDALALFAELEAGGDRGPLLELPLHPANLDGLSRGVMLTAYHHRRTAHCYSPSRIPEEVRAMNQDLPSVDAIDRARAMGFRTLVLHHEPGDPMAARRRAAFEQFARDDAEGRLERLAGNDAATAWALRAPAKRAAGSDG